MNISFAKTLDTLAHIMTVSGEPFRAKAYTKAADTIRNWTKPIQTKNDLSLVPNVGASILERFAEFQSTGTIAIIESYNRSPLSVFSSVYGIGPKKAQQLVKDGLRTIEDLRERQNKYLNDVQKKGLLYHNDIQQRIPRTEIDLFVSRLDRIKSPAVHFEIAGSYRRGANDSGDMDVIVQDETNGSGYAAFVQACIGANIVVDVLAKGPSKTLAVARLTPFHVARRIDFLFAPPAEYAFALLYFTGCAEFNIAMRQHALSCGYSLNEHGLAPIRSSPPAPPMTSEKDIFEFLGLVFVGPHERTESTRIERMDDHALKIYAQQGTEYLNGLSDAVLGDMVKRATDLYCNAEPVLSDEQYDTLHQIATDRSGTPLNTGAKPHINKVQLPFHMGSLNKIKDEHALSKWTSTFAEATAYVLSPKLDGIGGLYCGRKRLLYTKGDSSIGQDISHIVAHLHLPSCEAMVRGELIMEKQHGVGHGASIRTSIAGVIRKQPDKLSDSDKHILAHLHYVAYEVLDPPGMRPSEQLTFLEQAGFKVVPHEITTSLSIPLLIEKRLTWKQHEVYDTDGIVIGHDSPYTQCSDGNPSYAVAFKMLLNDQCAQTRVIDVIWTPSKDGILKPRIQYEPVSFQNMNYTFATGFNGAFIRDNNIGPGAVIEVVRSGDVIPYVRNVIRPAAAPALPTMFYTWTDTDIDILVPDVDTNPVVAIKRIAYFFKEIECSGVGEGVVAKFVQAGATTIPEIVGMRESDFSNIPGIKDKMAKKLVSNIRTAIRRAPIQVVAHASGIFGRGIGRIKWTAIYADVPYLFDPAVSQDKKEQALLLVHGLSAKTAAHILHAIPAFMTFVHDIGYELST